MKIVVIVPAYNEEKYLPGLLDSLANQSRRPDEVIIVDDGSKDSTPEIVNRYSTRYPFIRLVQNEKKDERAVGAKVVRAFMLGFDNLNSEDYDVVCKMDADLIFPPDYFKKLEKMFEADARVGIAGGICTVSVGEEWIWESVAHKAFLRGPIKAYRRACYEAIGGLQPVMGWDTIDQLKARYLGWQVKVDPNLLVRHLRPTNTETRWQKINLANGQAIYQHRYGLVIALYSCLKRSWKHRPYVLSGLFSLAGYFLGWLKQLPFHFTKEEAKWIRQHIWGQKFGG